MLLVALVATAAFAACGGDDAGDGGGGTTTVSTLSVRPLSLTFTAQGGQQTVSAQAPSQPTATSTADWCQCQVGPVQGR